MTVTITKNADLEAAKGWLLVEDPVAKLDIHEVVVTAACSTDDPGPESIKDFKLQKGTQQLTLCQAQESYVNNQLEKYYTPREMYNRS